MEKQDIMTMQRHIEDKLKDLTRWSTYLKERSEKRATTEAEYEKQLSITILKLKNNNITEFEGQIINNPPATMLDKIAKGICWKYKLEMDKAESSYKNLLAGIDITKTEINALQSLLKYID